MRRTLMVAAILALAASPASWAGAEGGEGPADAVETLFSVLVGFPATGGESLDGESVDLEPGTVISVSNGVMDASLEGDERIIARGEVFAATVGKLWETFRLEPRLRIKRSRFYAATPGKVFRLPDAAESQEILTATMLSANDESARYRLVFTLGEKQLSDTTVTVKRGERAVVGGMDGAAAPYIFVIVEPDPTTSMGLKTPRYKEGVGVSEPVKIHGPPPKYPESARRDKIMGLVVLYCMIDVDGTVKDVRVLREANTALSDAAVEAVRGWRFEPAKDGAGKPVAVYYALTVKFNLR